MIILCFQTGDHEVFCKWSGPRDRLPGGKVRAGRPTPVPTRAHQEPGIVLLLLQSESAHIVINVHFDLCQIKAEIFKSSQLWKCFIV